MNGLRIACAGGRDGGDIVAVGTSTSMEPVSSAIRMRWPAAAAVCPLPVATEARPRQGPRTHLAAVEASCGLWRAYVRER